MNYFISYFSGCGGASYGAKLHGWETIGVEWDAAIASIYKANIGDVHVSDVREFNPHSLNIPSPLERRRSGERVIWQLSPPCQEYSVANRNANPGSDRGTILSDILWHLDVIHPDAVFLENVTGYFVSPSFQEFCAYLIEKNYAIETVILNSADFGVPQTRERLILRAQKREYGTLPPIKKTHTENPNGQVSLFGESLDKWVGWYEAIADLLPDLEPSILTDKQREAIQKRGLSFGEKVLVNSHNGFRTQTEARPSFTILLRTEPKALLVQRLGYSDLPQVRESDRPSWTVMAGLGDDQKGGTRNQYIDAVLENADVRSLNHLALARFQSFPKDYQWHEKPVVNILGIGNAVPPLLSFKVLESFGF